MVCRASRSSAASVIADERRGHRGPEHVARDQEHARGRQPQHGRRQRRQDLPCGQPRQRRHRGERVVDGVLGLPRRRHLVDRLGDVDAGGIGVLEELRRPGGDMRVRAGPDRRGVVLDEQHRHEGHERHHGHQQHGPAEAVKRQLRPPAPADRVGAETEPAREDERQRQRVGHVGEAQHGEREADGAGARGQDPERLVGAQGIGQQQPDEAEAPAPNRTVVAARARSASGTAEKASWRGLALACQASASSATARRASRSSRPRRPGSVNRLRECAAAGALTRPAPGTGTPDCRSGTGATSCEARSRV